MIRRVLAVSFVAFLPCACDGGGNRSSSASGGAAGPTCRDYVTPDGYTCCCGQISCSRVPGCSHPSADVSTDSGSTSDDASGGGGVIGNGGTSGTVGTGGAWYPGPTDARPGIVVWATGGGMSFDAGGAKVDTENDPANCGAIGHACSRTVLASGQTLPSAIALDDGNAYWIDASIATKSRNAAALASHVPPSAGSLGVT